ncbi:MAG TPA: metallophosphoesterase [Parvularculaceae bacterium]|mgnify:CR=1 FL=1|nr:metallophosphoesterase [Parvularculaceae bacterium]HNS85855.1 metallophosphoesterase [Parvularculaceae bacterium]
MRLAHLTDLHLPLPVRPSVGELLNKRILGYMSWRRVRQFRHRIDALEAVAADCRHMAPDFTAISGDLVNISLEAEFSAGAQWLKANFDQSAAAMAPGNHDAYVKVDWERGLGLAGSYMRGSRLGETAMRAPVGPRDFPFVRTVNDVGLIFANSSPPTAPWLATGRLGRDQIDRIGAELDQLGAAGKCRVLILHHPITDGATTPRKALRDRAMLRETLFEKGAELVLHGHTHRSIWATIGTKHGQCAVLGGASASHPRAQGAYRPARYNFISITRKSDGWRMQVEVRELDPADWTVRTVETRMLTPDETSFEQ